MNYQQQQFYSARWFQIGVLAVLAVVLMIGAAYFFGTGLRADTVNSVAASPIGSSLSNVREIHVVARSPLGSSLTAVRENRFESRYDLVNASSAAGSRLDDYYGRLTAGMSAAQFAARFGIPAAAGPSSSEQSSSPVVKPSAGGVTGSEDFYNQPYVW